MSARSQDTLCDHDGVVGEEVTVDHLGSPERLGVRLVCVRK